MSGAALGWAKRQRAPSRSMKALLVLLGDYADEGGWAWPAIATMAAEAQFSERQVVRLLAGLVKAQLLVRCEVEDKHTRRTRTCAYFFPLNAAPPSAEQIAAYEAKVAGRVTQMSPWEGDTAVTPEGDMDVRGRVTSMSPLELPLEPEVSDEPSGAGARVREAFDRIKAIWPVEGMDWTHVPRALASFEAIVAEGVDPEDLAHAASSAVEAANWRKPPSLNTWLDERRWEARLPGRGEVARLDAPPRSAVPVEVLDAFAAAEGSTWTATYVAPAGWNETEKLLLPRTRVALDRLRAAWPREAMAALGVRLGEVVRADLAQTG